MSGPLIISRLRPSAIASITEAGTLELKTLSAIVLRNAGTATVSLWNGLYTLDSKETLSFNVTEEMSTLDVEGVPVAFDTSTGAVQKLQIIVIKKESTLC